MDAAVINCPRCCRGLDSGWTRIVRDNILHAGLDISTLRHRMTFQFGFTVCRKY